MGTPKPAEPIPAATIAELHEHLTHKVPLHLSREEHGNNANAAWAASALCWYGKRVKCGQAETVTDVFTDLLADLLHLSDALDVDFEQALVTAEVNYTNEVDGDPT